ncbi:MAG: molybdopterin-dependent oxidoreductase [Actinomycetota bacterium]
MHRETNPPPNVAGAAARARRPLRGATIGFLTVAIALGVAELIAAFVGESASPVIAVGGVAVDATPEWLKSFAIRTFGEQDKLVLTAGIVLVLAVAAVALGIGAVRRRAIGYTGVAVFAAIGIASALSRPAASPWDVLPVVLGAAAGAYALSRLLEANDASAAAAGPEMPTAQREIANPDRRRFLLTSLAVGGVAVLAGGAGRALVGRRFDVEASRASVRLPAPSSPAGPLPAGSDIGVGDMQPFVTPNTDFYRVDTALIVPKLPADEWTLKVHGMVDRPLELTYEQLLARPMIERDVTLTCVSNEIGGPYVGNARWIGAPLADLLEEAGIRPDSTQLVSTSIDGMTIGTPVDAVLDGRDAMLAIGMNGEPLPPEHGFPVRMVVPGLYGYVSATKWLIDLEASTFEAFDPYWVRRGWAEEAPIETMSRIDTPRPLASVPAGSLAIGGVAWAQHVGIDRVEVRVDQGDWQQARLAEVPSIDTWRQWSYAWDATPGNHTLEARAIDGDGQTQTSERSEPFPDGATGWHSVVVTVT